MALCCASTTMVADCIRMLPVRKVDPSGATARIVVAAPASERAPTTVAELTLKTYTLRAVVEVSFTPTMVVPSEDACRRLWAARAMSFEGGGSEGAVGAGGPMVMAASALLAEAVGL